MAENDLPPGMMATVFASFIILAFGVHFAFVGLEWPAVAMVLGLGGVAVAWSYIHTTYINRMGETIHGGSDA